jgi:ABC-type lipoprotein export system ATPase subunit
MIITNLTFKFNGQDYYFFNDTSVEFASHEINFITGENGVGKSTLLHILQGTHNGSELNMTVSIDNTIYRTHHNSLSEEFTDNVRLVQQNYQAMLALPFSFMENLQLARMNRYPNLQRLPEAKLFSIIEKLRIDIHKPVHLLSGGQRQLLAILMALQQPTRVLLLDEPTATLDAHNACLIMECLILLAQELKITLLIICHDKELMREYAKNTFIIRRLENNERIITRS